MTYSKNMIRSRTSRIVACLAVVCVIGVPGAGAVDFSLQYQKSEPEWERNRQILDTDYTSLEFKVKDTVNQTPEFRGMSGSAREKLKQDLELVHTVDPADWISIRQSFHMGMARQSTWEKNALERVQTQNVISHRHQSRMEVDPADWLQLTLENTFDLEQRDDQEGFSVNRDSRVNARLTPKQGLELEPYFRQRQEVQHDQRERVREYTGVNFSYQVSKYTRFEPEMVLETIQEDDGRVSARDRFKVGVNQVLYRRYLDFELTPEFSEQSRDWDEDYLVETYTLNNALVWKPIRGLSLSSGSRLEKQQIFHTEEERWNQRIHSELRHRLARNMTMRVRGEYDVTERDNDLTQFNDSSSKLKVMAEWSHQPINRVSLRVRGSYEQQVRERSGEQFEDSNNRIAVAIRPEYQITSHFSTSAEYRLDYRDQTGQAGTIPSEEQTFMVNLIGYF